MKNNLFYILGFIIITIVTASIVYVKVQKLSEDQAISILKNTYPEFKNYPRYDFPPEVITTEKGAHGWYVAFSIEGSGIPIIHAKCFFVDDSQNITSLGEFRGGYNFDFSIKFCDGLGEVIPLDNLRDNELGFMEVVRLIKTGRITAISQSYCCDELNYSTAWVKIAGSEELYKTKELKIGALNEELKKCGESCNVILGMKVGG